MRTDSGVFRFGPFELDPASRHLMRGHERIALTGILPLRDHGSRR